jgi:sec-independent protein translocase protein TatA
MGLFDNPWHILIVLLVLVLLFGSAKLPKAAKSMGEAMRIFKKEAQKLHEDDTPAQPQVHAAPQQVAAPAPPPVATPATAPVTSQDQIAALKQQMDALEKHVASQASNQPPNQPR